MKKLSLTLLASLLLIGCSNKNEASPNSETGNEEVAVLPSESTNDETNIPSTDSNETQEETNPDSQESSDSKPSSELATTTKPGDTKPNDSTSTTKPSDSKPSTSTGSKPNTSNSNTNNSSNNNTKLTVFDEIIPAGYQYIDDNTLPMNQEVIKQAKVDGLVRVTVTITNGVESRQEVIIREPVLGIMLVGTKQTGITSVERGLSEQAFNLINDYRASKGLHKLIWSEAAYNATITRSKEIATYFSHTRPNGTSWHTVAPNIGAFGENLTAGSSTPAGAVQNWKDSPAHNDLLLISNATHGAVGFVFVDGVGMQTFWVLN